MNITIKTSLSQLSSGFLVAGFISVLFLTQMGCPTDDPTLEDTTTSDETTISTNADPASAFPSGATHWKIINPATNHEDGPFALPGEANPNNCASLDPQSLSWTPSEVGCSYIHYHGSIEGHGNPDLECGHGGLVYFSGSSCPDTSVSTGVNVDATADCTLNGSTNTGCTEDFLDVKDGTCTLDSSGNADCTYTTNGTVPATLPRDTKIRYVAINSATTETAVLSQTIASGGNPVTAPCVAEAGTLGSGHDCSYSSGEFTSHFDTSGASGCYDTFQLIIEATNPGDGSPTFEDDNLLFTASTACSSPTASSIEFSDRGK